MCNIVESIEKMKIILKENNKKKKIIFYNIYIYFANINIMVVGILKVIIIN
jgi:hypothetical protein